MKTESLNEFIKLMDKIPAIAEAYKNAFSHSDISHEIDISFVTYDKSIEVKSSYNYGSATISVDTKDCIILNFDGFEASAFDYGDEITYSINEEECIYFKLLKSEFIDMCFNPVTHIFSFTHEDTYFQYKISDIDDARTAYFQCSTIFSGLICEEEFVNQFIAYFKIKDIMSEINPEFSVQLSISTYPEITFSEHLDTLKYPKVQFE